MALTPDQFLYLGFATLGAGTITLWVLIDHLNQRVKARAKVEQTQAREETRREIAAYVAEGSIAPDDAAKLMAAGAEGLAGGLSGLKATLRDCIDASNDACRTAGGVARQAAARAKAQQRFWGIRFGMCDDGVNIDAREEPHRA